LHWPAAIEGSWNKQFSSKTKLLIIEALMRMTLAGPTNEAALRAVAVRLYGIWECEHLGSPHGTRVRNCLGKLLAALVPSLQHLDYRDFIHDNKEVKLEELQHAASTAATNPDGYLDHLTDGYARGLEAWAKTCSNQPDEQSELPSLASADCGTRPHSEAPGSPA
jgi:hypothetical protein